MGTTTSGSVAFEERPTRVRYWIVILTMLSAVLLYLDRFCISFAERYIRQDLNLSNDQVGWLLSAFFWTYALAQVPSGFLSDRFGARRMLTVYILLWSLFTGLTGLALGFAMLMVWRFGFGVAQAGAYPTSAALIGRWMPLTARGTASSLVAFGGRIGGFIAPILTAFLIVWFVPPSVSSRIEPDDILDYPQLCYKLTRSESRAGRHILVGMPPESQENIRSYGARMELAHQRHRDDKVPLAEAVAALRLPEPTPAHRQALVDQLNQVLDERGFYVADWFEGVALPREAQRLLEQPESLDSEQQQRLNRLLLEALFPQALREVYLNGWRPTMIAFGLAGLVVAALFWMCVRERPGEHPLCNFAERAWIVANQPAETPRGPARGLPWRPLLTSASMWLMCVSQFTTNIGWVFLVTWLPRYLADVHRLPIEERGVLASIPISVGWAGMLAGGWLTDRLSRALGVRWGRALPLAVSRFLAMAAYVVCIFEPDPYLATVAFSIVAFSTDLGSPSVWAFNLDVGGRYVGSILGWGNMFGNFGAAVSPLVLNHFIGGNRWDLVFLTCALSFSISGLCALGTNASIPIRPRDDPEVSAASGPAG